MSALKARQLRDKGVAATDIAKMFRCLSRNGLPLPRRRRGTPPTGVAQQGTPASDWVGRPGELGGGTAGRRECRPRTGSGSGISSSRYGS